MAFPTEYDFLNNGINHKTAGLIGLQNNYGLTQQGGKTQAGVVAASYTAIQQAIHTQHAIQSQQQYAILPGPVDIIEYVEFTCATGEVYVLPVSPNLAEKMKVISKYHKDWLGNNTTSNDGGSFSMEEMEMAEKLIEEIAHADQ
jgi:hypothetical protein